MKLFLKTALFAIVLSFAAVRGTEPTVLNGLPIVTPQNPSPAVKTAALELSSYLEKISGLKFRIVSGTQPAGKGIFLVQAPQMKPEEWSIGTKDGSLVITGGIPRGVLYGVYHFLEDVLGVRWWSPTSEYIPSMKNLSVPPLNLSGCPAMPYRSIYNMPDPPPNFLRFYARNRLNTQCPEYGGRLIFGGNGSCHTLYSTFGKERICELYQKHPEYFPLIGGQRKFDEERPHGGASTQLCLTNPELRKEFLEAMRARIRKDREKARLMNLQPPMFYAIDQNDTYDGFCQCEKCRAAIERKGGATSGLLLDFTNFLAENLKNEAPNAVFLMMACHVTEKPPLGIRPLPNVGIRLADTTSNVLKPWTDPQNSIQRGNLEAWSKICDKVAVWDYSIVFGNIKNLDLPYPNTRTFAPDIRFLKEHNGIGMFIEHEHAVTSDMHDLKVWVETKLLENPSLDGKMLVEEFVNGYYGKDAGKKIMEYLRLLETSADKSGSRLSWFPKLNDFSYLDYDFISKGMRLFDEAEDAVKTNPELRSRVRHARMSLDKAFLLKYNTLCKYAGKTGKPIPDFETVLTRTKEVWNTRIPNRKGRWMEKEIASCSTDFYNLLKKQRDLPIPEKFRNLPPGSGVVFASVGFDRWVGFWHFVKDPDSPAGEALRVELAETMKPTTHIHHRSDKYRIPFPWRILYTLNGKMVGKTPVLDGHTKIESPMKPGYHWYRIAEKIPLTQQSRLEIFSGLGLLLDGIVCDSSELGQLYEIWVSMKFEGPDYTLTGEPTKANAISIDQVAVIRQTLNRQAK